MDDTNPTARALACLAALQDHPGIRADRLARILGTSERAARRYVSVLRAAGVPVESTRGRYGGYRLGRGTRLPPMMFSAAEALGLVMAVLDGHHAPADDTGPVGGAVGKIVRALPTAVAGPVDALRRSASAAPDRAAARPDPDTVTALVAACGEHRRTALCYRTESGSNPTLDVDPWAVVVRHGRWYLLCHSHAADATRAYRIDRIGSVTPGGQTFDPPGDLDPVALLEQHLGTGWPFATQVEIDAPLAELTGRLPPVLGRLEAVDDTTTRLTGSTGNPHWYAEQLVQIRHPFRVLGDHELRHAITALADRLAASVVAQATDSSDALIRW